MSNCTACGAPLREGDIFCGRCGKKQTTIPRKHRRRSNGEGSVYRCGSSWRCVVVLGYKQIDGVSRAIRKTKSGFATKREALEYLPLLKADQTPRDIPTLTELWEQYQEGAYKKLSASRQEKYRIAWAKIEKLQYCRIDLLTTADLQQVINEKAQTYYPARDIRDLLSMLYQVALPNRYVTLNLADYLTLPDLQEKEQQAFDAKEITSLWQDYTAGNWWTGYILLMCYTGMMPGELLQCRKEFVNLEAHTISGGGLKTKQRKQKPIILADSIIPVVETLMEQTPGEKLIRIGKDNFYDKYYAQLERIGLRRLPPYSCRHTTATVLASAEIPPIMLKEIMRHAKFSSTERYIHPKLEDELAAANAGTATIPRTTPVQK